MAIFSDKPCAHCGKKTHVLGRLKFDSCYLCKDCEKLLSPFWPRLRNRTPADIEAHIRYRAENRRALAGFQVTDRIRAGALSILIDGVNGNFVFADEDELKNGNPDLLRLSDLKDIKAESVYGFYEGQTDDPGTCDYRHELIFTFSFLGRPCSHVYKITDVSTETYVYEPTVQEALDSWVHGFSHNVVYSVLEGEEKLKEYYEIVRQGIERAKAALPPEEERPEEPEPAEAPRAPEESQPVSQPTPEPEPQPAPEPEPQPAGWTCPSCGRLNKGKFCRDCGAKKPAEAFLYRCDKCGWVPEDPADPPRFCPECGDPFDESDRV